MSPNKPGAKKQSDNKLNHVKLLEDQVLEMNEVLKNKNGSENECDYIL